MERADAARNRRAILRAAEEFLEAHDLAQVSMDRVAARPASARERCSTGSGTAKA